MENDKIFNYANLLRVELGKEIDTTEIENYFPQTISENKSDYTPEYIIKYNLSQYGYLKNTLPSFARLYASIPQSTASEIFEAQEALAPSQTIPPIVHNAFVIVSDIIL